MEFLIIGFPSISLSLLYFKVGKDNKLYIRIIKSAHGILILIAYYFSVFASQFTNQYNFNKNWLLSFNCIIALAAISGIAALNNYINWKWHVILVVVGVPLGIMAWLGGYLTIIHDSI